MASAQDGGIPFWKQKRQVLRTILGGYSQIDIADAVYPDDPLEAHRVAENFRKWVHSVPKRKDGPKKFFDDLAKVLGCEPNVTGSRLVHADLDAFIELLPPHLRATARDALKHDIEAEVLSTIPRRLKAVASGGEEAHVYIPRRSGPGSITFKPMMIRKGVIEPIEKGIREGFINQRHYYLTPEAAANWDRLVRADAYPTYDHCKAGLRALVSSEAWSNAVQAAKIGSVAMLTGGGAPSKDMVIINDLLRRDAINSPKIPYFIIDVSFYMLFTSMWWLDDTLSALSGGARVEVSPVYGDVLELEESGPEIFRADGGGVLFGITGGTIGNLDEAAFFRSLNAISVAGDLLILSADTLDDCPSERDIGALISKYRHQEMQRFVSPAVRALAGKARAMDEEAIYRRIEVKSQDAGEKGLSKIPGSVTIVLSLEEEDITLLSSTRYHPKDLISFASDRGWEHMTSIPSPLNPAFRQFLMRRI